MAKLVALNLDGTLERGVAITLEISAEGHPFHTRISGHLPPSPELLYTVNQWQETYLRLGGDFRIKIKSVESGAIQRQKCDRMSDALKEQFTTWLRADSLRALNEQILEELRREEPVRVLIRTQDPLLRRLPWHEWDLFERYPLAEYALSSPNAKRIQKIESTKSEKAVKVLAILGNDDGIDTQSDRQLLDSLGNVEFLVKPNRQTINDQLWSQPWDILFFAGHSETEGNTGRIYINSTDYLTIEQLKYGLQQAIANGLQLAIFNSCDGLGLATALEHLHIPQLIIMREPVPDRVAQTFLRHFLTAYASGKSLYLAEREAREKLHGMEDEFPCASWLPVIVQNSAEVPPTWQSLRRGGRIAGSHWDLLKKRPPTNLTKMSHTRNRPHPGIMVLTSFVVSLSVLGLRWSGLLQNFELRAFDHFMQIRPYEPLDDRLLLVKVTAEDIKALKEYPLSDKTLLQLLQKLDENQPTVIGLNIYRDRPEGSGRQELIDYLQQSDRIIPTCEYPNQRNREGIAPPPGILAKRLGFASLAPRDPDGMIRRLLLAATPRNVITGEAKISCSTYYAMSVQLASYYLNSINIDIYSYIKDGILPFLNPHEGFYQTVDTSGYQLLLNYRSNLPNEVSDWVSASDVLNGRVAPERIRHKIVLIGVTDPTATQGVFTPYNSSLENLLLQAEAVSHLLSAVKGERPLLRFFPWWIDALWISLFSAVGVWIAWKWRSPFYRITVGGTILIVWYGSCLALFLENGELLPLLPCMIALVGSHVFIEYSLSENLNDSIYTDK